MSKDFKENTSYKNRQTASVGKFLQIDSSDVWPATIEIPLSGVFSAIYDERGPSIRSIDGDDVMKIADLPGELFAALHENPAWARAIGTAVDKAWTRGRDSGLEEGSESVQRNIRRALGLSR